MNEQELLEKFYKIQIITDVKRDIDLSTFQPLIRFGGELNIELVQDLVSIVEQDRLKLMIGTQIINQIFEKVDNI